jgi:hypothetical protein
MFSVVRIRDVVRGSSGGIFGFESPNGALAAIVLLGLLIDHGALGRLRVYEYIMSYVRDFKRKHWKEGYLNVVRG